MWRDTEFDTRRLQTADAESLYEKYVISVPRLFPSEAEQETIETIAQAQQTAVFCTVFVPFLLQFFLKKIMGKTWPLLNQLQLVSMLIFITAAHVPVNVQTVNESYENIINLSLIPPELVEEYLGDFKDGLVSTFTP